MSDVVKGAGAAVAESVSKGSSSGRGSRGVVLARRAIEAAQALAELNCGTTADDQQRAVLEAFPGWGPVSQLFDAEPSGAWADLADKLDDVAGEAMTAAARVVDTSFFTPAALVGHIWDVLRQAGFAGGSVLDLGCGAGAFLRHAPADLPITFTGVEVDPISAHIARVLYPSANIIVGDLLEVSLPQSRFDACVGNVPFSSARVYDSATGFHGPLHQYFVARAVSAVRPGGYVVVVTSRHELDAQRGLSASIRRRADLIAAVRLPSGYFRAAGTDVVADVLILRVRDGEDDVHGWQPNDEQLRSAVAGMVGQRYVREWVSGFWELHPQLVAGNMRLTGFDRQPLAVDADDAPAAVAAAFAAVGALLVPYDAGDGLAVDLADIRLTDDAGRKQGSLHIVDGQVVRAGDGALTVLPRPSAELRALIGLRDAAVALVEAESDWDLPDAAIEPLRATCRTAYEAYVDRYGALNRGVITEGKPDPDTGMPRLGWRTPPMGGFRSDPDAPLVFALELFDQDTGEASAAPILSRRVNKRPKPAISAGTAGEALAISLGEGRGLDLERIAALLGLADGAEAFDELGDLVYRNPGDGRPLTARDYLCGDVRAKLREALAAAAMDPRYERNVAALEAVQPPWLGRDDIRIELGSPWVNADDIGEFCLEVFGTRARVEHVAPLAAWDVESRGPIAPEARIAYCTDRMDAFELLQIGLNGAAPVVRDEVYDPETRTRRQVRNADATEAAEQKLVAIQERFSLWVWEKAERERRIVDQYNQTMNAHVLRNHNGAHLTFPGLAEGIELWSWQRDFVDRAVSTPAVYCAHEVGLGKTLTSISVAMTLRQFGLANRPALVVPLHLIEQATRQCYQAWPSGRFLVVTRDDLHGDARRRFVARVATGDWDLVIMTHETFTALPLPAGVERAWLEDQLGELENFARTSGYNGKRIATAVRSLQGRLEKLRARVGDPKAITFSHLGLDYVIVDEADKFRRLPVTTRADGFSLGSSKRALDLYLKLSLLRRAKPDQPHACLMTGTPFTNTLAEAYVWQSMLAPEQLQRTGLQHFDAWAAQFVRYKVLIETSPDGSGFRSKRRPGTIQNVPELRTQLSLFMSMVRAEGVGLSRPQVCNYTHLSEPTERQREFMDTLVERADALRKRMPSARTDNMLVICNDGRKVALDPNLVGISEDAPKLAGVADRVAEIYHNTRDLTYEGSAVPGAFQLVMCDLGTPVTGSSQSYGRIRAGLIARGVPAEAIRFVHEATTPKAREALFAACRDGRVAVLLGSTSKVGIGTNLQLRLHSLHHVDPTWTAAAWLQRNGRIERNGNLHEVVGIHSHVARSTFDAFMFGTVERKARGFEQLYRMDGQAREIEDIGDETLTFGELKAAAAGNDLLLRQHELQMRVRTLRLAHVTVQQNVKTLLHQGAYAESAADAAAARVEHLEAFAEHSHDGMGSLDLTRVAQNACLKPDPERPYTRHRVEWRDGRVSVRIVDTDPGQRLELVFDYRALWAEPLPGKVRRRGPEAVKAWAESMVGAWSAGVDREMARTKAREIESRRRAREARNTAAATDVGEPAELVAARADLEEVGKAINAALNEDTSASAA
ncbi:methyltransferase type 11 [Mycobacterium avium]|nr:methyltransferase type 11 [Mycobacterium avium]